MFILIFYKFFNLCFVFNGQFQWICMGSPDFLCPVDFPHFSLFQGSFQSPIAKVPCPVAVHAHLKGHPTCKGLHGLHHEKRKFQFNHITSRKTPVVSSTWGVAHMDTKFSKGAIWVILCKRSTAQSPNKPNLGAKPGMLHFSGAVRRLTA